MIPRIATLVLLVEDIRQESLLRRFLNRLGLDIRNIRVSRTPRCFGAGEQYVREQYAAEVRELRGRAANARALLIACIDADTREVRARRDQFAEALRADNQNPRGGREPVLNLIAKRNIETWILCLNNVAVDELSDYRKDSRVTSQTVKRAVESLYDWTRPNAKIPPSCVPSLLESVPEFLRIPG
ncbi:MAG: hypothetical protein JSU00_29615 [Acidobacteria bacterium]|nr:hypothetical protein [Acidobacteriota bacterium]